MTLHSRPRPVRGVVAGALATAAALVFAATAGAHAEISPPVVIAKKSQAYTLLVPTEKEGAETTSVELTVPDGFAIDSFVPAAGWKRDVQSTGSGEETVVQKVIWSGGSVPTEEDAAFQFLATPDSSKSYEFQVRQTYSDGSVVDWSGAEDSETPAPVVEAKSSLGKSSSMLAVVALVVAGAALVVAVVAVVSGPGRRTLA
jgi:uncharacterized protein YcnI